MKYGIALITLCVLLMGCTQTHVTVPSSDQLNAAAIPQDIGNNWEWGSYSICISDDGARAEVVPQRASSLHLNVNDFVEGAICPDCLTIGKPQPQGDGSVKLEVWLRHPFPNSPEFTGFDVRGIVVFVATDYMQTCNYSIYEESGSGMLMNTPKLNYSDPGKGGAALLNLDGYTFYLNPLLEYDDRPILNYSKGKYAYGDNPDCTVNPYILFSDGSPRRMFKVSDFISRTFHIKLPSGDGPFEFGYVVQGCWAKPDNTPVTDPAVDFPVEANCEDPWCVSIEQLQPVDYDVTNQPLFKATLKHRPLEVIGFTGILVPTLSSNSGYDKSNHPIEYRGPTLDYDYTNIIDDETTEVILRIRPLEMTLIGDGLVPGHHLGILSIITRGKSEGGIGPYDSQLYQPLGVMPVDVYVEL